jgi:hypothetical protein
MKFRIFLSKIRPEEWLALAVFLVANSLNIFLFREEISLADAIKLMLRYFTFGDPVYYLFFSIICILAILIFYTNFSEIVNDWLINKKAPSKERLKDFGKKILEPLRNILPLWLVSGPMYQLLSQISYYVRFGVEDVLLARADYALIHHFLFIDLATNFNSEWFGKLMYYSYVSLSTVIGIFLLFLLFKKYKYLLRLSIAAFIFSFIFSYPLFYLLPATGPLYSLIINVRKDTLPEDISTSVSSYRPSAYTEKINDVILTYYVNPKKDNSSAVSCIPSMHATWAIIVLYFLYRVRRKTLLLTIPWIILMLTGGLYFSQHYFVDYLTSIPIAMLSILCAYFLIGVSRKSE